MKCNEGQGRKRTSRKRVSFFEEVAISLRMKANKAISGKAKNEKEMQLRKRIEKGEKKEGEQASRLEKN